VYIDPGELLDLMQDQYIALTILDVRDERDWNLFRLRDAERITLAQIDRQGKRFAAIPGNGVVVVMGNDEAAATEAWKHLMALVRPNVYILSGGLNNWLAVYGGGHGWAHRSNGAANGEDDVLRYRFRMALGDRHPASAPDPHDVPHREYQKKVRLLKKIVKKGGCG
jgi:rhodanese-related sulfurtransferase